MNKRDIGIKGEHIAGEYITNKGFAIIKRNYHSRYGEIDIIAVDDKYILFIEVKTRAVNSFGTPAQAVDSKKMKKIIITANDYIYKFRPNLQPRFDVIEVVTIKTGVFGEVQINHIENAFTPEDTHGLF